MGKLIELKIKESKLRDGIFFVEVFLDGEWVDSLGHYEKTTESRISCVLQTLTNHFTSMGYHVEIID